MTDWSPEQFEFDDAGFEGLARLFPLPDLVLFPHVMQPLHIFEPRYREMVQEALATDRLIAIARLKPGWEPDYEKRPAVFPLGCSGLITHVERLQDGRYNIVLRGIERFRILAEDHARSFRRAAVEPVPSSNFHQPIKPPKVSGASRPAAASAAT